MTLRDFDPRRLDVVAFAKQASRLEGSWLLEELVRLAEVAACDAPALARRIVWSARGEQRPARGGEGAVGLHLVAAASLPLECQRCLQPVDVTLDVVRNFLFVHGESAASELDAQCEDDVLALTRALDLRELIEDELLLALPLVPRHAVCPQPLAAAREEPALPEMPNPFAALKSLKRPGSLN